MDISFNSSLPLQTLPAEWNKDQPTIRLLKKAAKPLSA
jgi:hypothetical protein